MREKEEDILNMLGIGKPINATPLSLSLEQIAFPENIIYRRRYKENEGKILRKCEASVEGKNNSWKCLPERTKLRNTKIIY